MSDLNELVLRLKNLRMESGMTQRDLAKVLEVNQSYIGRVETGAQEPSFEFLEKGFAYFEYKLEVNYLLSKRVGK